MNESSTNTTNDNAHATPGTATKLRSLLPLLAAAVFMLLGTLALVYLGRDRAVILNAPLGDFELLPLLSTDETPTIHSVQGKTVVIHFWGTWCGPCRSEYPEYAKLSSKYEEREEVQFLSVSCSPGREENMQQLAADTKSFLDEFGITMPIYSDPAAFTRGRLAMMMSQGGFAYPTTLVIDKQGVIRMVWRGTVDMKELQGQIEKLIAAK